MTLTKGLTTQALAFTYTGLVTSATLQLRDKDFNVVLSKTITTTPSASGTLTQGSGSTAASFNILSADLTTLQDASQAFFYVSSLITIGGAQSYADLTTVVLKNV